MEEVLQELLASNKIRDLTPTIQICQEQLNHVSQDTIQNMSLIEYQKIKVSDLVDETGLKEVQAEVEVEEEEEVVAAGGEEEAEAVNNNMRSTNNIIMETSIELESQAQFLIINSL